MAKPQSRSCNAELGQGLTDGSYKQVVKDRGGQVESGAWEQRKQLSVGLYGVVELAEKECPDGVGPVRTPYTVDTPTPGIMVSNQGGCGCGR
jgi:hypothetical protein